MRRYLLVGEAPSSTGKKNLHLCLACKAIGHRPRRGTPAWLRANHGSLFKFTMATRHVNLLGEWPGHQGRGSAFPLSLARPAAERMLERRYWGRYDGILLAGRRVAAAFNVAEIEYFERIDEPFPVPTHVVPHPSGINRWWNDPCNVNAAREFLEGLA